MFIGVDLKEGKHKVVMRFENQTILYGFIISILDLPIFIMLINESRKENNQDEEKERKD